MAASAVHLKPGERLSAVRKEWHTRKRAGKDSCYILVDRFGKLLLLTQKLPVASSFIITHLISPNEPHGQRWQQMALGKSSIRRAAVSAAGTRDDFA
jgi:hypothetical protein